MAGTFVKALYDFHTTEQGEISLRQGDIIYVSKAIDDNWLCGSCCGKFGNFPSSFVGQVSMPTLPAGHKLFAATEDFTAQAQGDLGFIRGEIIQGLDAIDANWWRGQINYRIGIFPLTHVQEITVDQGQNQTQGGATDDVRPIATAVATTDMVAQLDEELSFQKGDTIDILENLDSLFCVGICNGQKGSFPLTFVEIISGSLNKERANSDCGVRLCKTSSIYKDSSFDDVAQDDFSMNYTISQTSGDTYNTAGSNAYPSHQTAVYNQNQKNNASSAGSAVPQDITDSLVHSKQQNADHVEKQNVTSNSTPSIQSTHYDNSPEYHSGSTYEIPSPYSWSGSYTSENTAVTSYGKTLFPFIAENSNELTFFDNEIVTLVRHIDDFWMEGELDGKQGIFPTSYIEIIVDCPRAEDYGASTGPESSAVSSDITLEPIQEKSSEITNGECYGLALYDFLGENDADLNLREGDTVTVLEQIDEYWFRARHDDGTVGFCPINYIEIIDSEIPEFKSLSPNELEQKNDNTEAKEPASPQPPASEPEISSKDNIPAEVSMDTKPASSSVDIPASAASNESKPVTTEAVPPSKPVVKPVTLPVSKPPLRPKPALMPKPNKKSPMLEKSASMDSQKMPSEALASAVKAGVETKSKSHVMFTKRSYTADLNLDDIVKCELAQTKADLAQNKRWTISGSQDLDQFKQDDVKKSVDEGPVVNITTHNVAAGEPPPSVPARGSWVTFDDSPTSTNNQTIIGQSTFYSSTSVGPSQSKKNGPQRPPKPLSPTPIAGLEIKRAPVPTRKAPPRPMGPRPSAAARQPMTKGQVRGHLPPQSMPQRPAPPRPTQIPTQGQRTRPGPAAGGNLIEFSPPGLQESDDTNAEIISDLKRRISEVEKDLQKYIRCKDELEQMMTSITDESDKPEVQENIAFYQANVEGLQSELTELNEKLEEVCPGLAEQRLMASRKKEEERQKMEQEKQYRAEMIQKRREKRVKVIAEMLQTEKEFLQSLQLCIAVFMRPEIQITKVDMETLLGNIEEVAEVSQKLLSSLEGASSGKEFEEQIIGHCFVELCEDMKAVYGPYCKNHDEVLSLLKEYEADAEIQEFFNHHLESVREHMNVFDLGSLLIKPVQRILKYPLLLNELIKATEEEHPDKSHLLAATNSMTDVAAHINEVKRRKDLVLKYRTKDTDVRFSDKISKLNLHSLKKKSARIGQRLSSNLGVAAQTVDENYMKEETKFRSLEKAVKALAKDIASYIEQVQEVVYLQETVANDIADYYSDQSSQQEVRQFCDVHNVIATQLFMQFKDVVEQQVLTPINQMVAMFHSPNNVMKKRYDKLLDYDSIASKLKNTKDSEQLKSDKDHLVMAKKNYEALNAQLLDELPRLYELAVSVIQLCVGRLVTAQKSFYQKTLDQMYKLLALPLILSVGSGSIIETFNIAHIAIVEKLSSLSFIPRAFNPRIDEIKEKNKGRKSAEPNPSQGQDASEQSDSQKMFLRQKYTADRLWWVAGATAVKLPMDIALSPGTLVGVIKEGDPMGNKDRWFIDTGSTQGFVSRSFLSQSQPGQECAAAAFSDDLIDLVDSEPLPDFLSNQPQEPISPANKKDPSVLGPEVSADGYATTQSTEDMLVSQTKWHVSSNRTSSGYDFTDFAEPLTETSVRWNSSNPDQISSANDGQEVPPPSYSEVTSSPQAPTQQFEYYRAVYSFQARTPVEISMAEGQVILVKQKHDLDGNSEWWLVEVDGKEGYAPANYLYQMHS